MSSCPDWIERLRGVRVELNIGGGDGESDADPQATVAAAITAQNSATGRGRRQADVYVLDQSVSQP
jgi:hypothetical protein